MKISSCRHLTLKPKTSPEKLCVSAPRLRQPFRIHAVPKHHPSWREICVGLGFQKVEGSKQRYHRYIQPPGERKLLVFFFFGGGLVGLKDLCFFFLGGVGAFR